MDNDKKETLKIVLEVIRYVISALLGFLGGGIASSCSGIF